MTINQKLEELKDNKDISKKLYSKLIIDSCYLAKFRLLVKLHKTNLGFRPIINGIKSPLVKISKLIEKIIYNFVWILYSRLSQGLIYYLKNKSYP